MSKDRELYFDDFKPGDTFESAPLVISEDLILEFGRFYDPQVFHLDPEAAKETIYGGLIASGLQTIAHYLERYAGDIIARKKAAMAPGCPLPVTRSLSGTN